MPSIMVQLFCTPKRSALHSQKGVVTVLDTLQYEHPPIFSRTVKIVHLNVGWCVGGCDTFVRVR